MKEIAFGLIVLLAGVLTLVGFAVGKHRNKFQYDAHVSECSYCNHRESYAKGSAIEACQNEDGLSGTTGGHIHICELCSQKYVCSFGCTLPSEAKQKFELGLKERK